MYSYNVQCASVYLLTALMPGESNPGKVPVSPVGWLLSRRLRRCWWVLLRPRSWLQDEDVRTLRVSFSGLGPTEKLDQVRLGNQARCSLETDQVGPGNGPDGNCVLRLNKPISLTKDKPELQVATMKNF